MAKKSTLSSAPAAQAWGGGDDHDEHDEQYDSSSTKPLLPPRTMWILRFLAVAAGCLVAVLYTPGPKTHPASSSYAFRSTAPMCGAAGQGKCDA